MEIKNEQKKPHSITIENRRRAMMTGVIKVVSSNETSLMLETHEGGLYITGAALKINKFDAISGELTFEGTVNQLKYSQAKLPLAKRLFK